MLINLKTISIFILIKKNSPSLDKIFILVGAKVNSLEISPSMRPSKTIEFKCSVKSTLSFPTIPTKITSMIQIRNKYLVKTKLF